MPEAFKDIFFQRPFFDDLVAALQAAYPEFDAEPFLARIFDDQWAARALKDKMRHATLTLHDSCLPITGRRWRCSAGSPRRWTGTASRR